MLSAILEKFEGKKTYIVAVTAVAYGVYMGVSGDMPWPEVIDYVLGGSALATVRSALNKVGL